MLLGQYLPLLENEDVLEIEMKSLCDMIFKIDKKH